MIYAQDQDVFVTAVGNVFMHLAPIQMFRIGNDSLSSITDEINDQKQVPELNLNHIQSSSDEGNVWLTLDVGRNLYSTNGKTVTIPLPGTLEYDSEATAKQKVYLSSDYEINGLDMLAYYEISRDPSTGLSIYQLPNGTVFYMDSNREVVRIEEAGTAMAVGEYTFHREGGVVTSIDLNGGVSINLQSGLLTVAENTNFEVVMEAVSADWLNRKNYSLFDGDIKVRFTYTTGVEATLAFVEMGTWNGKNWYYMEGMMPDLDVDQTEDNFMIAWDQNANTVNFYRVLKVATTRSNAGEYVDEFKNLNPKGEKYGEAYWTARTKAKAFGGDDDTRFYYHQDQLVDRKNVNQTSYTIDNFLGTEFTIRLRITANGNEYDYKNGDKWIKLNVIPVAGLGVTVNYAENSGAVYTALKDVFWDLDERTKDVWTGSVKVQGKGYGTITPNEDGDTFYIVEPYHHADPWYNPFAWYYEWKEIYLQANEYFATFKYITLEEASASLANEKYSTITYYVAKDKFIDETEQNDENSEKAVKITDADGNERRIYFRDQDGKRVYYEKYTENGTAKEAEVVVALHYSETGTGEYKLYKDEAHTQPFNFMDGTTQLEGTGAFSTNSKGAIQIGNVTYYPYYALDEMDSKLTQSYSDSSAGGKTGTYYVSLGANGVALIIKVIDAERRDFTGARDTDQVLLTIAGTTDTETVWTKKDATETYYWKTSKEMTGTKNGDTLTDLAGYTYSISVPSDKDIAYATLTNGGTNYYTPKALSGDIKIYTDTAMKNILHRDVTMQQSITGTEYTSVNGSYLVGKTTGSEVINNSVATSNTSAPSSSNAVYHQNKNSDVWTASSNTVAEGDQIMELYDHHPTSVTKNEDGTVTVSDTYTDTGMEKYVRKSEWNTLTTEEQEIPYYTESSGKLVKVATADGVPVLTKLKQWDTSDPQVVYTLYTKSYHVTAQSNLRTAQIMEREYAEYYDVTFKRDNVTGVVRLDKDAESEVIYGTGQMVLRFGDARQTKETSKETPTMTFSGPIDNIELRATTLNDPNGIVTDAGDKPSYRITNTMYLTKSGLVVNRSGNFTAKYNGVTYDSTKITATGLKLPTNTSSTDSINRNQNILIKNGQEIWREMRTDQVATDRNGDYWLRSEVNGVANWTELDNSGISKLAQDENGEWYWTGYNKGKSIPITESLYTNVNVLRDGIGTVKNGTETMLEITLGEEADETGDHVLYYMLPVEGGTALAGSDGTVRSLNGQTATQKLMASKGIRYMFPVTWAGDEQATDPETGVPVYDAAGNPVMKFVPNVQAGNDVTIWLLDTKGSLLDGDITMDTDIQAARDTRLSRQTPTSSSRKATSTSIMTSW